MGGVFHKEPTGPPSREVKTQWGPVIGVRVIHEGEQQVDAFLGIPYAKPPVGRLRFRHAQSPEPWTEPRMCTKFGPRGMQKDMFFWTKWSAGPVSEDCLYLNVFAPVWENPKGAHVPFPVMVFVHGGGFVSDSSVKYGCHGICEHLVKHGVVVVTIQYRLGYFGFWAVHDSRGCPDNLALWDQTAALRWVHHNIESFGGDPGNVTLFGQSAGGASVDLLSLSPHSRDLFHKVCPMAGNANCEWAICQDAVERCQKLAEQHDIHETDSQKQIAAVRNLDAAKLALSISINVKELDFAHMSPQIGPRYDGVFFPKPLSELRKEAPKKPRLIGTTQAEGLIMMLTENDISLNRLKKLIADMIPESIANFEHHREHLLRLVIDPERDGNDKKKLKRALVEIYGDAFLNIGTQRHVIEATALENPTWLYSFDYFNPRMWGFILGNKFPYRAATHCTELSYLFGVGIIMDFKLNKLDQKMLRLTTKLWTNFATYGNPNGSTQDPDSMIPGFRWENATADNPQLCLSIQPQPFMTRYCEGRPLYWAQVFNGALENSIEEDENDRRSSQAGTSHASMAF